MGNDDTPKSIDDLRQEMVFFRKILSENAKDNTNFAATLVIFNTILLFLILWRVW